MISKTKRISSILGSMLVVITMTTLLFSCDPLKKYEKDIETDITSLKEFYAEDFIIGAAVEPAQLLEAPGALLRYHFSGLTCENAMKFKGIHPEEDTYNFEAADLIADFARKNGMKMRGHTFVWHHPAEMVDWAFMTKENSLRSSDEVYEILKDHMTTLMDRYNDVVYAWDVLNEAVDPDTDDGMRHTRWYETLGPDYGVKLFKMAREIDPDVKLFYNDYQNYLPARQDAIYDYVKGLIDGGAPIDGIGLQMHIGNNEPEIEAVAKTIERYRALGLEIHITELTITMAAHEFDFFDTPPESHVIHQAHRYKALFELFKANKDVVTNVTLWGFYNGHCYLNDEPPNYKEFPFPFSRDCKANLSYTGAILGELPPDQDILVAAEAMVYQAPKGSPTIDGEIDAIWEKAPIVKTETVVVGSAPSTASVRVLWDESYIYVLAEVADSKLAVNAPESYMNDSLEIFLDQNNAKSKSYEKDDYQFRISCKNFFDTGGYAKTSMGVSAAKEIEGGYLIEFSCQLDQISAEPGLILGIDFQVNENDGSGARTAISKWNDTTNESWKSTAGWGELELVE